MPGPWPKMSMKPLRLAACSNAARISGDKKEGGEFVGVPVASTLGETAEPGSAAG